MFICFKTDVECNETTPTTSFDRLHEEIWIRMRTTPNSEQNDEWENRNRGVENKQIQKWNQQPLLRVEGSGPFSLNVI